MGTDITFFAERKSTNGNWKLVDTPYRPSNYIKGYDPELEPACLDIPRWYYLFAMLADVRNGIRVSEKYIPISKPKGLPDDISQVGRNYYEWFEGGADNASWLTKSEILNYDSSKIIQHKAMVEKSIAHLFKSNPLGFPDKDWPRDVPISHASGMKDGKISKVAKHLRRRWMGLSENTHKRLSR